MSAGNPDQKVHVYAVFSSLTFDEKKSVLRSFLTTGQKLGARRTSTWTTYGPNSRGP